MVNPPLDPSVASNITYILTDIDDTLTKDNKLSPQAYSALWKLTRAGLKVIPVTGRPAGWCDLIARQWPVEGVVGENGAFVFYEENGALKHLYHPDVQPDITRKKLEEIKRNVLSSIPGTRVAKDQFSRLFDLAIDFSEEPPKLGLEEAQKIKKICEEMGATAKISSIHVNAWFGKYNKLQMAIFFLQKNCGLGEEDIRNNVCFCGDSANDEPMFQFFPIAFGVSNIKRFLSMMKYGPRYITEKGFGEGFAECMEEILEKRKT